nr:unnamed protein product [Digitaria exilis]
MAKGAGDTEEKERAAPGTPADAKKMKRSAATDDGASSPGAGLCDDVIVGNILARLPARAAVASMALSKHHRRLIRSTEFRGLHCRLAPPLPRPHIAYLATAPIKRRPEQEPPGSWFLGFHVAGAGASGSSTTTTAPMRSLAGRRYVYMNYVNTCNGVVLLASEDTYSAPCSCVLWNPAVADVVEEVTVPDPNKPARDYLE